MIAIAIQLQGKISQFLGISGVYIGNRRHSDLYLNGEPLNISTNSKAQMVNVNEEGQNAFYFNLTTLQSAVCNDSTLITLTYFNEAGVRKSILAKILGSVTSE